jgi:hypothetical protein
MGNQAIIEEQAEFDYEDGDVDSSNKKRITNPNNKNVKDIQQDMQKQGYQADSDDPYSKNDDQYHQNGYSDSKYQQNDHQDHDQDQDQDQDYDLDIDYLHHQNNPNLQNDIDPTEPAIPPPNEALEHRLRQEAQEKRRLQDDQRQKQLEKEDQRRQQEQERREHEYALEMERQQVEHLRQQQAELEAQQKQAKKRPYSGRRHSEPAKDIEYVMDDGSDDDGEICEDADGNLYENLEGRGGVEWGANVHQHGQYPARGQGQAGYDAEKYGDSSQKKEKNIDLNVAEPFVGYEDDELEVEEFEGEEFDLYNNQNLKNIQHIDQFVGRGASGAQNGPDGAHLVTKESEKVQTHPGLQLYDDDDDLQSDDQDLDNEDPNDLLQDYEDEENMFIKEEEALYHQQQNMASNPDARDQHVLQQSHDPTSQNGPDTDQKGQNDSENHSTVIKKDDSPTSHQAYIQAELDSEEEIEQGRLSSPSPSPDNANQIYPDNGDPDQQESENGEEIGEEMINF